MKKYWLLSLNYALTDKNYYEKAKEFFSEQIKKKHNWTGVERTLCTVLAYIYNNQDEEKLAKEMFEMQRKKIVRVCQPKKSINDLYQKEIRFFLMIFLRLLILLACLTSRIFFFLRVIFGHDGNILKF